MWYPKLLITALLLSFSMQGYAEEVLFHDDFDEGVLSSSWEWFDPKEDSILAFSRPGWLEIKAISGNDLQPRSNLNAPRLFYVEAASGDFALETSISAPKDGKFQSGGLLVWKDDDNFLRFEKGTWGTDTVVLQKREQGIFGHVADLFFEKSPTYLRLERRKSKYKALVSEDGKKWEQICDLDFQASDPLRVGIHAVCMGIDFPPTFTDFDYFKLCRTGDEAPYVTQIKTLSEDERNSKQHSEDERLLNRAREVLSETAAERRAENRDTVIDPETGVRFRRKYIDERFDVITNDFRVVHSPDGRFLFDSSGRWVVPVEGGEPFKLLEGYRGDIMGEWSPDMKKFAFLYVVGNSIWVMPVSPDTAKPTGPPRKIIEDVVQHDKYKHFAYPDWSPDSKRIAFASDRSGNKDIWIVSAEGNGLSQLMNGPDSESSPAWSPDGKVIAYTKYTKKNDGFEPGVWTIPASGGEPEKLVEGGGSPGWSPDGKWLCLAERKWGGSDRGFIKGLTLVRLSDKRSFKVAQPDQVGTVAGYPVDWSLDSKQLVFFKSGYDWKSSLMVVNAYGGPWVELGKDYKFVAWGQTWTPDGERVVTESTTDYWWIVPTKGGSAVRFELRPEPRSSRFAIPSFSPDLTKAAYVSRDGGLWVLPVSVDEAKAAGEPVKVGEGMNRYRPCRVSWSPDSRWIAFPSSAKEGIWFASVKGGKARQLTEKPGEDPQWSPDSKWVSWLDEGGIWLIPLSDGKPKHLVESDGIKAHAWSPDGKEMAFMGESHISVVNSQTGEVKQIIDLEAHNLDGSNAWNLVWSPDGEKLGFICFKEPRDRAWVVSVAQRRLTEVAEGDSGEKYSLAWSPDGKKISYNSDRYFRVRTGAIWTMDIEEIVNSME